MSGYFVGLSLIVAALAVFLTGLVMLGIRAFALMKRVKAMSAKPAFRAAAALPVHFERIDRSIQRLSPMRARFDEVARLLAVASANAAGLLVDIDLVASATEDLLDAVAPSLRGVASI